jgi:D-tyrosyl-tRNA(Tyr) deacylase
VRALLQRVSRARVDVGSECVATIGAGLLVLVGVRVGDVEAQALALAKKVHRLRVLRGERSLADEPGAHTLVVSQFTLYADTRKGRRPSWSTAAPASVAEPLVAAFAEQLRELGTTVRTGAFGADMAVELVNDGPVTVLLEA